MARTAKPLVLLVAFSVDPGLRLHLGDLALELSTRIGLTDDARHPYGELTGFLGLSWLP